MTKQILITLYILFVLLLSGMTKADATHITISNLTGILTLSGVNNDACHTRPTVMVRRFNQETASIILDVVGVQQDTPCSSDIQNYEIAYDLKELRPAAHKIYQVTVVNPDGRTLSIQYNTSASDLTILDPYRENKQNFKGLLVELKKGPMDLHPSPNGYFLKKGDHKILLVSPEIDLAPFRNHEVWISGYAVKTVSLETTENQVADVAEERSLAQSGQEDMIIVPVSVIHN